MHFSACESFFKALSLTHTQARARTARPLTPFRARRAVTLLTLAKSPATGVFGPVAISPFLVHFLFASHAAQHYPTPLPRPLPAPLHVVSHYLKSRRTRLRSFCYRWKSPQPWFSVLTQTSFQLRFKHFTPPPHLF